MRYNLWLKYIKKEIENTNNKNQLLSLRYDIDRRRKLCCFITVAYTISTIAGMNLFNREVPNTKAYVSKPIITTTKSFNPKDNFLIIDDFALYNNPFLGKTYDFITGTYKPTIKEKESSEEVALVEESIEPIIEVTPSEEVTPAIVTNEEKINIICEKYNLTKDQFNVIVAVVLAEAESNSYEDAYAVINTIYNRSISSVWIYDVDNLQGSGLGTNIYNQVIQKGQFDVYWSSKSYLNFLDVLPEEQPGAQAVIDFLYGVPVELEDGTTIYLPERLHNYVNFVGQGVTPSYKYYTFTSHGNRYGVAMKEEHYTSHDFTEISEADLEARALLVEQSCQEYLNKEENSKLKLTKN